MPGTTHLTSPDDAELTVIAIEDRPGDDAELVRWACRAARDSHTPLELVHSGPDAPWSTARLEAWLARQHCANPACVSTVGTDPITALLDASQHASLIVVGSHRSSRLAAYLTGAVANHLPAVSRCPVALVPLTTTRP